MVIGGGMGGRRDKRGEGEVSEWVSGGFCERETSKGRKTCGKKCVEKYWMLYNLEHTEDWNSSEWLYVTVDRLWEGQLSTQCLILCVKLATVASPVSLASQDRQSASPVNQPGLLAKRDRQDLPDLLERAQIALPVTRVKPGSSSGNEGERRFLHSIHYS